MLLVDDDLTVLPIATGSVLLLDTQLKFPDDRVIWFLIVRSSIESVQLD